MIVFSDWINEFWKWNNNDISLSELFKTLILVGPSFDTKLFVPIIWTLRIEMIISFILPFLIYLALRVKVYINIIIFILFFFIGKDILSIFYLGIILAIYKDKINEYVKRVNVIPYSIVLLFIASILYTSRFSLTFIFPKYNKISYLLTIFGCASFLIFSFDFYFLFFFLKSKFVWFLGKVSYSLYLFHFPILLVTSSLVSRYFHTNSFFIILFISLPVTLFISNLSYQYIEMPFIDIGKKVANRVYEKITLIVNH
jgi:peptidoglycan/LPS O-acetylase OafA/YrhL